MFEEINKKYNTIVIDPPWNISLTGKVRRREHRAEKLPYKTMSLQEIKEIPINKIANIGCHVYCWTTNKMLRDTFDVFKNWDVNFHLVMPIVKPSGIVPAMGYTFASEFILLGFYRKPMQKFSKIGKLNWIKTFNKSGTHSRKSEEIYNLIREMSPQPRIDIFSRRVIAGFDNWGDESPNQTQTQLEEQEENKMEITGIQTMIHKCPKCQHEWEETEDVSIDYEPPEEDAWD